MAQTGERTDPFRAFNFMVELDGIAQGRFAECSGLGMTTEVIENGEGGNPTVHKVPGRTSFTDITLKWGVTDSTALWAWRQRLTEGTVVRKNGSIVVFDLDNRTEVARWNFTAAWPKEWQGPAFNATGDSLAVETLVLAHEGVTRV